jgi:hypothetical protein
LPRRSNREFNALRRGSQSNPVSHHIPWQATARLKKWRPKWRQISGFVSTIHPGIRVARFAVEIKFRRRRSGVILLPRSSQARGLEGDAPTGRVLGRNSSAPVRLRSAGRLRRHRVSSVRRQVSARARDG